MIPTEKLKEIKELAESFEEKTWNSHRRRDGTGVSSSSSFIALCDFESNSAQYIAACSPEIIKELIEEVLELRDIMGKLTNIESRLKR